MATLARALLEEQSARVVRVWEEPRLANAPDVLAASA